VDHDNFHDACDRNVAAALRHFAVHAEGAVLSESPAAVLVAAAVPFAGAFHNAAFRVDRRSAVVLEEMSAFSARWERELILWASSRRDEDLVRAAGLRLVSSTVGMAISEPPDPPIVPRGVELHRVADGTGVAEFTAVHEELFRDTGRPVEAVAHFASPGALLAADVAAFVVRMDARPVACAMVVVSGPEAGVYWVATRSEARRRGFGEIVTRAAVRAGFEHGARVVVLQSSAQGLPLYRRLGFVPFTEYARYLLEPRTGGRSGRPAGS
jgi:ribosomal protein S18 acetylase RimI-like enzyme